MTFRLAFFLSLNLLFVLASHLSQAQQDLTLWYDEPARNWNEALPVGNGRLGAMIFGQVDEELIQLNEETLWSGGPANNNPNPEAATYLPALRKAIFDEDYTEAEALSKKMQGLFTDSYEPLGDLKIIQQFDGEATAYRRDLDISKAIATTSFTVNNVQYTREIFVSKPAEMIVVRLAASSPGALQFSASLSHPLKHEVQATGDQEIGLFGQLPAHIDPSYVDNSDDALKYNEGDGCKGMRFALLMKAQSSDGQITATEEGIEVKGATEVVLYLSAATSYNGFDKCPDKEGKDEKKLVRQYLTDGMRKSFPQIKKSHQEDYQQYFDRVSLQLNPSAKNTQSDLPTDERLMQYATGAEDAALEAMYFQYGRYLLISSSRPGGIPANLQGIWNPHVQPPWSSNFTININTEMNYWPAEVANLSELHTPLLELIDHLSVNGAQIAKNFYGADGWVAHHNTDMWAVANPVGDVGEGDPKWANWEMGGAWLSQHLWEHYQFTGDKDYLKKAYPVLKGAATFCLDWLVKNPDGKLVTAPSTSPENAFITENGEVHSVSQGTTMDMAIIWECFTNVMEASKALDTDSDFRQQIEQARSQMLPLQIGKKGNLQEWYKDWEDEDPEHRHVSHLFALHPGRQISPVQTPEYAQAAAKTLELRGDGGTGWSKAWKINFWARLHDGNHAYKLLRELLKITGVEGTQYAEGGGTYPNLFCAHPPFQIDGNFGGTSGISEMMIQSQDGAVHLLPAIPDDWKEGEVKGLKARGGFEVDMKWKDGKVTYLKVSSELGGNCRLRVPNKLFAEKDIKLAEVSGDNPNSFYFVPSLDSRNLAEESTQSPAKAYQLFDLTTEPGASYTFTGE